MYRKIEKLMDIDYGDANGGYTIITKPADDKSPNQPKTLFQKILGFFLK